MKASARVAKVDCKDGECSQSVRLGALDVMKTVWLRVKSLPGLQNHEPIPKNPT